MSSSLKKGHREPERSTKTFLKTNKESMTYTGHDCALVLTLDKPLAVVHPLVAGLYLPDLSLAEAHGPLSLREDLGVHLPGDLYFFKAHLPK